MDASRADTTALKRSREDEAGDARLRADAARRDTSRPRYFSQLLSLYSTTTRCAHACRLFKCWSKCAGQYDDTLSVPYSSRSTLPACTQHHLERQLHSVCSLCVLLRPRALCTYLYTRSYT
eukprot:5603053-Prymnesium_polylepis.1